MFSLCSFAPEITGKCMLVFSPSPCFVLTSLGFEVTYVVIRIPEKHTNIPKMTIGSSMLAIRWSLAIFFIKGRILWLNRTRDSKLNQHTYHRCDHVFLNKRTHKRVTKKQSKFDGSIYLMNRCHPRRWEAVVTWEYYLIPHLTSWFLPQRIRWSIPLTCRCVHPVYFTSTMLLPMASND